MRAAITQILKCQTKATESQDHEYHLRAALAAINDAVITTDLSDRITYMNSVAETLTGWPCIEAAAKQLRHVFAIVHADTGDSIGSAIQSLRSADVDARFVRHAMLVGEAARPAFIEYRMVPILDAHAALCGVVIVFRDISNRRAAELALQTSEQTLLANTETLFEERERSEVTLNSIGDAVISTDFRGRISYINNVAELMTGWAQTEVAGRSLDEIFFLVDSTTREHISCPAITAIIENRKVKIDAACLLVRRDGTEIAVEESATPIHDKGGGVVGAVMVAQDVTAARDQAEKLTHLALYDSLTGIPNRALFSDRLGQALARARRSGDRAAVLFVDLDRFKPVNDSLGHAIGDELLRAVAQRLLTCVRGSDTVGRYGGDEFTILIADIAKSNDATLCAEKVKMAFDKPYEISGHTLQVTASIGIACFPDTTSDEEALVKYADVAMYEAKRAGSNQFRWFCSLDSSLGGRV